MSKYLCHYPDGVAGLGLLLARTCYAAAAFGVVALVSSRYAFPLTLPLASGCVALMLVTGFATRWAALFLGIGTLVALPAPGLVQQLLLVGLLGGCSAITVLGAGAYSVDALRYGRRVVHVQTRAPDRGRGR